MESSNLENDKAVCAEGIAKSFGTTCALKDVTLGIERGEIFGIIGPDGAGKTTLIRILTTLLLADSGRASVDGFDVVRDYRKIRGVAGYMPGRFSLYQDLSVEENLEFFAAVFNTTVKENYHMVKDIYSHLEPFRKRKAGALSGGMKQKLALSCALIHRPSVLFLDEPTTGVDPVSRKEFWEILKRLKKEGITILVATPYMDEAVLCDRIALMQGGAFLKTDTPEAIARGFRKQLFAVRGGNMFGILTDLRRSSNALSCYAFGDAHHVTADSTVTAEELKRYLASSGHDDAEVFSIAAGIEDCFMELTHNGEGQ